MSKHEERRERRSRQPRRPAQPEPATPAVYSEVALVAVLCLLAAGPYLAGLSNPFVYDDQIRILDNPSIRPPWSHWLLTYSLFRPLVNVSYAVDYALWGPRPMGFHLTSLLLHVANVLLFYAVSRRAFADASKKPVWPPFVALPALLFAIHPMMTEAVGYASARGELLAALAFLPALLCLRRAMLEQRARWTAAGIALMLAGLAAKETVAMLPFVAFAYDRFLLSADPPQRRWRLWRVHAVPFALVGIAALGRVVVYLFFEPNPDVSGAGNVLVQLGVFWRYVGLLVLPVGQSIIHQFREVSSIWELAPLVGGLALAAVAVGLFRKRRSWPLVAFGSSWFVLLLLPSSSFVPLNEAMAEHRVYLASCGFFLAAGAAASRLAASQRSRVAWGAAMAIAAGALATATVVRLRVWSDPVTLWGDAVEKSPDVYASHFALGGALRLRGDCARALPEFERAVSLMPEMIDARLNLGICLAEVGRSDDAARAFDAAVRIAPGNVQALYNRGIFAERRGRIEQAVRDYRAVLALDPSRDGLRAHVRELEAQ